MSDFANLEGQVTAAIERGALDDAATLIVQGYGPGILGYLMTLVGEEVGAREAFSEFAEELWKSLPRFAGRSSVKTWVYGIAVHCALRFQRARARRRTRPLRESEVSKIAASVRLSASFARTTVSRKLEALRQTLSPSEQTLLVLRIDRNMSWEEIAAIFGKKATPALLRKRFQRLKERLKRAAEQD